MAESFLTITYGPTCGREKQLWNLLVPGLTTPTTTAHVEQKNWTWARQLLGYGRLEDPALVTLISALYREVWAPWQNFFLPCFKLQEKWREGSPLAQAL